MTDERRPWERQEGEPTRAYHAFVHYRDVAAFRRSLSRASTVHQVLCLKKTIDGCSDPKTIPEWTGLKEANKRWKDWKREWNWDGRAEAHDREVAEQQRLKQIAEIERMNERHANIASVIQSKVIERLTTLQGKDLTPGQMVIALKEATTIERRARGEATDIVQEKDSAPMLDLTKLTADELDAYERLLQKASPGNANAA